MSWGQFGVHPLGRGIGKPGTRAIVPLRNEVRVAHRPPFWATPGWVRKLKLAGRMQCSHSTSVLRYPERGGMTVGHLSNTSELTSGAGRDHAALDGLRTGAPQDRRAGSQRPSDRTDRQEDYRGRSDRPQGSCRNLRPGGRGIRPAGRMISDECGTASG